MEATAQELETLERIQALDVEAMRSRKELDELPQRAAIAEARKKRTALEAKLSQVEELGKEARKRLTRIEDEDASLQKKEHGVQAAINAAQGDYRNVEARTKELAGIEKRRFALKGQREEAKQEADKVDVLVKQVTAAIEALSATEAKETESFRKQGGALKAALEDMEAQRKELLGAVSTELLAHYDKALARSGGVALGRLVDNRCGVCRATIDSGRLIDLRAHAPLGECPSCKRLLIIG